MATKYITIGSLGNIHGYDNVDYGVAMDTDNEPIAIGQATDPTHAIRKDELPTFLYWVKIAANSITLSAGTSAEGLADLQTRNDGNVYHITEAAATPGITLIVDFISVTEFSMVNILATYEGSATHALEIELYNWTAAVWDHFDGMQTGFSNSGTIFHNHDFFVPEDANFIGTGADAGKVRVRINHPMAGNASHDVYIDVVALY